MMTSQSASRITNNAKRRLEPTDERSDEPTCCDIKSNRKKLRCDVARKDNEESAGDGGTC
jgi:hypothetical protein